MSSNVFLGACVVSAGAARVHGERIHSGKSFGQSEVHTKSLMDFAALYSEDPKGLLTSLNSGFVEVDENWFWRRDGPDSDAPNDEPAADAPIGGTNPTWAAWRPTILAIDGSDNLGEVSKVYTFGAPSTAKIPLTDDKRTDGCFEGYRIFNGRDGAHDPVSWLCAAGGFVHASMGAMTLFAGGQPPWLLPCSDATTEYPPSDSALALALHFTSGYLQTVREEVMHIPPHVETYAAIMRSCYVDHAGAAELGQSVGYRFVAEAANGNDLTRLFQHPTTLNCVISFRGSDNAGDWINNAGVGSRDFCNFVDVHSGFVQKFTDTVSASQFQTNIRANLPKCSSLDATGHSLGGALAEMFTGCINRGSGGLTALVDLPRRNSITVDHMNWMTYMAPKGQTAWFQGTPELMPAFA